ncbi:hypothetical protein T4E_1332 [Trichinella pseudospiralis]|uniref:Uncharacterized protein n=1 Tax=Trichinella pseudospiralis TaxID=6337 RepID=A0A0V0X160_TRIPS|nr:hypothetical protein T4E_1332 [Trichinella pseudospiralis]
MVLCCIFLTSQWPILRPFCGFSFHMDYVGL